MNVVMGVVVNVTIDGSINSLTEGHVCKHTPLMDRPTAKGGNDQSAMGELLLLSQVVLQSQPAGGHPRASWA
jgi:hypothetical protein